MIAETCFCFKINGDIPFSRIPLVMMAFNTTPYNEFSFSNMCASPANNKYKITLDDNVFLGALLYKQKILLLTNLQPDRISELIYPGYSHYFPPI